MRLDHNSKQIVHKFKAQRRVYMLNYTRNARNAVIGALGGKCVKCGFNDKRALQIDHINGGGQKDRKDNGYYGVKLNREALSSFLKGENKYQLLCANCNWIKRTENNEVRHFRKYN